MATALAVGLRAGALSSVSPTGASVGITVNITGTGFNSTAASNDVVFTPATGAPVTASGASLTTLDATTGLRRLSVIVPPGLPVGTTALRVVNRPTGETSEGRSFEVIALTLPGATSGAPGTTNLAVRVTGSPNTQFVSGTRVTFGAGITVTSTTIESPTSLVATVSIAATAAIGPRDVNTTNSPQSAKLPGGFSVQAAQTNHPPSVNPGASYAGTAGQAVSFAGTASDPDGDALTLTWNFGDGTPTAPGLAASHSYAQPGNYTVTFSANDGRGGITSATATATIAPAPTLLSLDVEPGTLRFSQRGATTALAVTGHYSDGTTRVLTGTAGTTYLIDAPQVATVDAGGLVIAVGNGSASITVAVGGITQIVRVVVEEGVLLQSLELTPPVSTLREVGATAQTTLWGQFSDGSRRNLTNDAATIFHIDTATVASISATGVITGLAEGTSTLTARNGGLATTAQVRVLVTTGTGFLRGEVFDDTRGLPLSGAAATLLPVGGAAQQTPADDRGRFVLPAGAGAALVRIERNGFTTVERTAVLPRNGVATLLDARLTPLDGRLNMLQSVFGGQAASTDGTATVSVPSGSLESDVALRVTPLSNQGLPGLLPPGWSPIAAVDLQPAGRRFAQPATLRLPHIDTLAAGSPVTLITYDVAAHRWVVQAPGRVSDDRRTLSASIDVTGQYAFVVPDDAPLSPPAAIPGEALAGLTVPVVPETSTATGQVVPRSAPPGDNARAVGTVVLQPPSPLPSGVVLRARVSEQFDLLDSSRVQPLPFVQDIVLYARPRLGAPGSLATRLPITPTLQFSIQQLSLGQVHLDVSVDEPSTNSAIVGAGGGSLSDAAGDVLDLPAGALTDDIAVGLLPLTEGQLSIPVPDGFTLLGAAFVDLVGGAFAQPALLSIATPNGLDAATQVVVAHVITDGTGGRRFKIVGVGQVAGTRLSVQTALGTLSFEGVRGGGEYAFLRPSQPLGFVAGLVNAAGSSPQSLALVTADTAPFAFVTDSTGTFIVAGRVGVQTTVAAIEAAGATASAGASLTAPNNVATLTLTLAQTSPAVTVTTPGANATSVALDASIIVDFSKPIDPATITASSVVLGIGQVAVATQPVLSANRRRLTITPASSLTGLTTYTLTLTSGIRDSAGVPLATFAPRTFTTLDPSKPAALALGAITAELPDEDGLSLITGAPGAAEGASAVVATNLRTQETTAVLALADGSFRLRLTVVAGDTIAMTLRDRNGRESTFSITQFSSSDGTTSIGQEGGTVSGAGGRLGRVLPRALATAGLFHLTDPGATPLPALPASFGVADRFALIIDGAAFRRLDSLTLTESQGRFAPETALAAPFASAGQLTIGPDFLVSASLRFSATVADRDGARHSASGTTVVVASIPDTSSVESGFGDQFPTVFLSAPKQAIPTQVLNVSAVAPTARVEFDLPTTFAPQPGDTLVLARLTELSGETKLSVVDRLTRVDVAGTARLRTLGRELPGATRAGEYAVVSGPLAFVTGRASGPAAVVSADGSPFVFETDGANGAFAIPVPAGSPFTLHFANASTGAALGTATGQAPASGGSVDIGQPLAAAGGALTLSAQPDARSIVDIGAPLVFTFSQALDRSSVTASAFVVADDAGARAFGSIAVSADARTVTFVPLRRWRFGTRYRYGVATSIAAASGARLAQTFSGEFTTFAPRVISTTAVGAATHDLDVSGNTAVIATDSGIATLDISSALSPNVTAQSAIAGGAHGVRFLPGGSFTDRVGATRTGSFAAVAAGNASGSAKLSVVDVSTPGAAAEIGSAQLPSGGIPNAVAVTTDLRALVSISNVGIQSAAIPVAVPSDPAHPAAALGGRYPNGSSESINQAAILGDRIVTAGAAGLTVLDATTFARRGGASTTGSARGVAVLGAFQMDVNGDGTVASDERLDLAVVANGSDGTLQIYRVPETGDPVLLSVIHFTSETTSVAVDADERLAYVGVGTHGLAVVDLDGPASVQPIDLDRNGTDDRILAAVTAPGTSERVALALNRGLGFAASGAAGITAFQLQPPRTTFLSIKRDPIPGRTGDEEEILASGRAFVSDAAIQITVNASIPLQTILTLGIEEPSTGERRLHFPDGALVAPLTDGLNSLTAVITPLIGESNASLVVRTSTGAAVASMPLTLVPPDASAISVKAIAIAPDPIDIAADLRGVPLSVAGRLADGRVINLSHDAGTSFSTGDPLVATVDQNGFVTAVAGGVTNVMVANHGQLAFAQVRVFHAPSLARFEALKPIVTLTSRDQTLDLGVVATFTDGTTHANLRELGTRFQSSNPQAITVDANGVVTAVGEGTATIHVSNGTQSFDVFVASEFRVTPNVAAIALEPFATTARTDVGLIDARATVAGSGSLEGLPVTFEIVGVAGSTVAGQTDYSGVAVATLTGLANAASLVVRASVTNPTNNAVLNSEVPLTVEVAGRDAEPNDSPAAAVKVKSGRTVTGSVGGVDAEDVFRSDSTVPGSLQVTLRLSDATNPADVRIVFFGANGQELGRQTPTSRSERLAQAVAAGPAFVGVLSVNGNSVQYTLMTRIDQAPVTIASVAPTSGPPGTAVTITGTGFSLDPAQTYAYFGGAMARIVSASATEIHTIVPASAVDGPVQVAAIDRRGVGPQFTVGVTVLPRPVVVLPDPGNLRADPALGITVDVSRLVVALNPDVTPTDAATFAQSVGATVAGFAAALNVYVFRFPGTTLAGLQQNVRTLEASPLVRYVVRDAVEQDLQIDSRDAAGDWPGTGISMGTAFQQVRFFDAIDAIRQSSPYDVANPPFRQVKVAVVDSGFDPILRSEAQFHGLFVVQELAVDPTCTPAGFTFCGWNPTPYKDFDTTPPIGHGTQVTSIIGAVNDGSGMSGGLNGVVPKGQQPFDIYSYARYRSNPPGINGGTVSLDESALIDIAMQDFDVVNMSFAGYYSGSAYTTQLQLYKDIFSLAVGRTLFVAAASNEGVDGHLALPSAVAEELHNVISVGATATPADLDDDGDRIDARAVWNHTGRHDFTGAPCRDGIKTSESDCGSTITLAAPGEDVLALAARSCTTTIAPCAEAGSGYQAFTGTSAAAPIVTAAAALVLAIKDLQPGAVRDLLVDSGDDISDAWNSNTTLIPTPMRRLNVYNAVVASLPPAAPQMVYVADQEVENGSDPPGRIIGIDVDPTTGQPITPFHLVSVPMRFVYTTDDGQQLNDFIGRSPTSLAISPIGDKLYAVVTSVTPDIGDGILAINTKDNTATGFVAFSGAQLDPPSSEKLTVGTPRTPLAVSRDGRLMYVAIGTSISIIDLVTNHLVTTFDDLPAPYNTLADSPITPSLQNRRDAVSTLVQQTGVAGHHGTSITALALSRDGRILYATVSTGNGPGIQTGGLIAINVDLYNDGAADTRGLQSRLSSYFNLITTTPVAAANGDEPQAIGVSNSGKYLYVVNGGFDQFVTANSTVIPIPGVIDQPPPVDPGVTVLSARGVTDVFAAATLTQPPADTWQFPSTVTFGWAPSPASGGAVITQNHFGSVLGYRPFAIAMNPVFDRAIVPMFASGNFAVLDLDVQKKFGDASLQSFPGSLFQGLSDDFFHGVVGVTQAPFLDENVWPYRGAFSAGELGKRMPSPDENLLFPSAIEYAQNGRFAVATHSGVGVSKPVTVQVPDFTKDIQQKFRLLELGFILDEQARTVKPPGGDPVEIGKPISLQRGGGAITFIDDGKLNLYQGAQTENGLTGQPRPYFSMVPVCETAVVIPPATGCISPAVNSIIDYNIAGGDVQHFRRPRGVAIQPFVYVESPRFGDFISTQESVNIFWRDPRVNQIEVDVHDFDQVDANGNPRIVGQADVPLEAVNFDWRGVSPRFKKLFLEPNKPLQGHRYRLTVRASQKTGANQSTPISQTVVEYTYDDPILPDNVTGNPLTLEPALLPLSPGVSDQLKVTKQLAGVPSNVTGQSTFNWIGGSSDSSLGRIDDVDPTASLAAIRNALSASAGTPVSFALAQLVITPSASITALTPGLELVRAHFDEETSNSTLVLAGFTLKDAMIEPQVLSDTLTGQIQSLIGHGNNPPLVLKPALGGFITDRGQVVLDNATLSFVNGGTIRLTELVDAVRGLFENQFEKAIAPAVAPVGATPAWRAAQAVNRLQARSGAPPLPETLGLTTTSSAFAVSDSIPNQGSVTANDHGLAVISGTLNLGGFGQAVDTLLAWSLSPLDTVTVDPSLLVIKTTDPVSPGPTLSSTGQTAPQAATVSPPPGIPTGTELVAKTLPVTAGAFNLVLGTTQKYVLSGTVTASTSDMQMTNFRLKLPVPNDAAPSITSAYSIADTNIATLGSTDTFAQHVMRGPATGSTLVSDAVAVDSLGSATGKGLILVTDCVGPVLTTRVLTTQAINPGDTVAFETTVANPTGQTLTGIVISVEARLSGFVISTFTLVAGDLGPGENTSLTFNVVAPAPSGTLTVTASAPGVCTAQQPAPVTVGSNDGGLIVTEMVLNPKQDWNDSTGGNGVPFDSVPGTGTVDGNDVWIEVTSLTATANWTLRLTDAAGATFSHVVGTGGLGSGVHVVSGFGVGASPIVRVDLIDQNGTFRQTIDVTIIESALGPATGPNDESLTWSVFGSPTPLLQQFLRRPATIGAFNPF